MKGFQMMDTGLVRRSLGIIGTHSKGIFLHQTFGSEIGCRTFWHERSNSRRPSGKLTLTLWPQCEQLSCNNQSALKLAKYPIIHARTRYVECQHHFVQDRVGEGEITWLNIPTALQPADILTKALGNKSYKHTVVRTELQDYLRSPQWLKTGAQGNTSQMMAHTS